jgi:hypothetical protein
MLSGENPEPGEQYLTNNNGSGATLPVRACGQFPVRSASHMRVMPWGRPGPTRSRFRLRWLLLAELPRAAASEAVAVRAAMLRCAARRCARAGHGLPCSPQG